PRLFGSGWRIGGSAVRSWRKTRTYRSVVNLKRSAQNRIGTLTLGRAWLGKLEFPTSGAHSPDRARIAKRRSKRPRSRKLGAAFLLAPQEPKRRSIVFNHVPL